MTRDEAIETEATLVIAAPRARETADTIAARTTVIDYRLLVEPDRHIRDVYVDDAQRVLASLGLALRWRRDTRDGHVTDCVTLKGSPDAPASGHESPIGRFGVASGSALTRLEIERPWAPSGWEVIDATLRARGIRLPAPAWRSATPEDDLRDMGLARVQARDTWRRPRAVVSLSGDVVAELAVDAVRYDLVDRECVHYEIEVEATSESAPLDEIVSELMAHHPTLVGPWRWSKLQIGEALVQLAARGDLGAHDELDAEDYARVAGFWEHTNPREAR